MDLSAQIASVRRGLDTTMDLSAAVAAERAKTAALMAEAAAHEAQAQADDAELGAVRVQLHSLRSRDAEVRGTVAASKGLVLREGQRKNSKKVGSLKKGDTLTVLELARTASGGIRARTAAGWTTATNSKGKHLIATEENLEELLIEDVFIRTDADRDGVLDANDLRRVMLALGKYVSDSEMPGIMAEIGGTGGEGAVSLAAFRQWWEGGGSMSALEKVDASMNLLSDRFREVQGAFAAALQGNVGAALADEMKAADPGTAAKLAAISAAAGPEPEPEPADGGRPFVAASAKGNRWHGTQAAPDWDQPVLIAKSDAEARPGYYGANASEYRDTKETLKKKAQVLAAMLRESTATCVYTGAGLSTATGIGDYASKAKGSAAPHMRGKGHGNRLQIMPTYGHHVLAALEQKGLLHHWLQQNHDRKLRPPPHAL